MRCKAVPSKGLVGWRAGTGMARETTQRCGWYQVDRETDVGRWDEFRWGLLVHLCALVTGLVTVDGDCSSHRVGPHTTGLAHWVTAQCTLHTGIQHAPMLAREQQA